LGAVVCDKLLNDWGSFALAEDECSAELVNLGVERSQ
jgi:hypothetical protein